MPPFDFLNPLRRVGTGIRRGVDYLGDQLDPTRRQPMPQGADVNPAELDHVRQYLTPGINGQPNPATQPRAVAPNPNAPTSSDRPPMPINSRPRQVAPPLDAPAVEAPAMERPTATRPRFATPYKAAENEYVGAHGKRGWKEALKGGLYGMAASGGQGGLGGLLGGFAGGALGQTIAPQRMAEARFAMGPGRRVLADQQMQRDDELYGLKVQGQEAQIEENRQQAEAAKRQGMLHNVPQGSSVITPTGREVYKSPIASRQVAPKWEWVTGPDGKPKQVNVNAPDYNPSGYQPYNRPDAGRLPQPVSDNTVGWRTPDGKIEPNPYYAPKDSTQRVTPAEARQRTENASREVQAHNKLRQEVIETGNQISALKGQDEKDERIPGLSAKYNALKQQFDAESERIRTTYADDLEDVGQGGWSFFKAKPRPAYPQRGNNDDAMLNAVRANPKAYADKMRAMGATEEQVAKALRAAGVQ